LSWLTQVSYNSAISACEKGNCWVSLPGWMGSKKKMEKHVMEGLKSLTFF